MLKTPLQKDRIGNISPKDNGDKGVQIFLKCISLKENLIAQLAFEIANYEIAAQHVNIYSSKTPPLTFHSHTTIILGGMID